MIHENLKMIKNTQFLFSVLTVLFMIGTAAAVDVHLDRNKVPQGCKACHDAHGKRGTVLLDTAKDQLCFKCHGSTREGGPREPLKDISSVLNKKSHHPILETSRYHVPGEELPEKNNSTPRHVSCYDCHNPHKVSPDKSFKGVRGYSGRGGKEHKEADSEYKVCYLCHSDSANLPGNSKNIALYFDQSNPSYHPIESIGKNRNMPSLRSRGEDSKVYNTASIITCSDCHGNDDPFGPQGPHGSNLSPLLKARYEMQPIAESAMNYTLCYNCHNRNSILNDESFKSHKRHVVYSSIPCSLCHDAHGSRYHQALINFTEPTVTPDSRGELIYMPLMPGKPRCFLSCHVSGFKYEHALDTAQSGQYCITKSLENDTLPSKTCLTEW